MVGAINLIDWLLPPTCPHCPGVNANSLHKLTFCHASALDDGYFDSLQDKSLKHLGGLWVPQKLSDELILEQKPEKTDCKANIGKLFN